MGIVPSVHLLLQQAGHFFWYLGNHALTLCLWLVLFADMARALELHFVETHNQRELGIAQLCFFNFLLPPDQTVP